MGAIWMPCSNEFDTVGLFKHQPLENCLGSGYFLQQSCWQEFLEVPGVSLPWFKELNWTIAKKDFPSSLSRCRINEWTIWQIERFWGCHIVAQWVKHSSRCCCWLYFEINSCNRKKVLLLWEWSVSALNNFFFFILSSQIWRTLEKSKMRCWVCNVSLRKHLNTEL